MSAIDLGILKYRAAIDTGGFKSALDGMDKGLATFARSAASSLSVKTSALKMPSLPKMGPMALGKLDATPAASSLGSVTEAAGRASSGFAGLALKAGAVGVGLAAVKLAGDAIGSAFGFLKDGVKAASDLDEALNATTQILGKGAPAVVAMADTMADKFGSSKKSVLETATSIAAVAKGAGISGNQLDSLSTTMTRLADDFGSVANKELPEVGKAFSIAFSGESSDLLKKYGVDTRQTAVEAYALSRGILKVGDTMEESQRVMAVAGILQEKLAFAMGDHERTAGGFANSMRKLSGSFENFGAEVGAAIMPVASAFVSLASDGLGAIVRAFQDNKATVMAWGETAATAIKGVGVYVANWRDTWEIAKLSVAAGLFEIRDNFTALGTNFGKVVGYLKDNWFNLVGDMGRMWSTWVGNSIGNITKLAKAVKDFIRNPSGGIKMPELASPLAGFEAKSAALPTMVGPALSPERMAIMDDLARLQGGMMAKMPKPGPPGASMATAAAGMTPTLANSPASQPAPILTNGQVDAMKKARTELETFAKGLKDKVRLPLEEKADILGKGIEAFRAGLIGKDELARLNKYADKEAGIEPKEVRFAGANQVGSTEAYSSLVRNLYTNGDRTNNGEALRRAQERTNKLLEDLIQLSKHPEPVRKAPEAPSAMN